MLVRLGSEFLPSLYGFQGPGIKPYEAISAPVLLGTHFLILSLIQYTEQDA